MSERIRIIDIAKKAGVSKGTVDRVIHKRGNVSPEARAKVMEAMKNLDYQRNVIASALAYNKNWRIASLLPEYHNDPFWKKPALGIKRAMKSVRDYGIDIASYTFLDGNAAHFEKIGAKLLKNQFDALLIAPMFLKESHAMLDRCAEQKIPYIQINTYLERSDPSFLCYIGQDSYQSGVLAAKLLDFAMSPGDQVMILHLESQVYNAMHLVEKEKGFENYFNEHPKKNIGIVKASFGDVFDRRGLHNYLSGQLNQHPGIKGIFVTTSRTYHIVELLEELGKEDLKLVGFDLIDENLRYLKNEKIDFLINQNPMKQGFFGIMNLFNHLILKKDLKKIQYLSLDVVMKENMRYYIEQKEEELHLLI